MQKEVRCGWKRRMSDDHETLTFFAGLATQLCAGLAGNDYYVRLVSTWLITCHIVFRVVSNSNKRATCTVALPVLHEPERVESERRGWRREGTTSERSKASKAAKK